MIMSGYCVHVGSFWAVSRIMYMHATTVQRILCADPASIIILIQMVSGILSAVWRILLNDNVQMLYQDPVCM